MIRPLAGRLPGLLLEEEFLRAWLQAAGVQERLYLACERLPAQPEELDHWDLWLELQQALPRSRLPDEQEQALTRAVRELGEGSLRVQAVPPEDRPVALQGDFPGLRGTAAVLEAVRLAWAAVLSAAARPQDLPAVAGQVSVSREDSAPCVPPHQAFPASAPDPCLLRLAELHNRLLLPDSPLCLLSLLDLRPWAELPAAAPNAEQERLFMRAAEAAGRQDAPELLHRGRQAWAAWVADPEAAASQASPPSPAGKAAAGSGYRQLAGAPGAPGIAAGPARLLGPKASAAVLPGEILICERLPPPRSAAALRAAGLVTEQGGRLSYGAVLASRAGIPCVCGLRGARSRIREGDLLVLDGQLGILGIRPARGPA